MSLLSFLCKQSIPEPVKPIEPPKPILLVDLVEEYLSDIGYEQKEKVEAKIKDFIRKHFAKCYKLYEKHKVLPKKWSGYTECSDYALYGGYWSTFHIGKNSTVAYYTTFFNENFNEVFDYHVIDNFNFATLEHTLKYKKLEKLNKELEKIRTSYPVDVAAKEQEIEQLKKELNDN